MRDFTLKKYHELCEVILEKHTPITVESYLIKKPLERFAILRHDVDRNPENALKMAEVESNLGIKSTYYFRMKKNVFRPKIIKEIIKMGHEVGYHYEVLDKAKGDFNTAIKIFEKELEQFREVYDVKTICMHGNPLTPWDNRDLWKHYNFREYGIIGEPYLSIDYSDVLYFSDTGRTWDNKHSVKDIVNTHHNVKTTHDLINSIKENVDNICIVTHPQRWNDSFIPWLRELIFQSIKNMGKIYIKNLKMNNGI